MKFNFKIQQYQTDAITAWLLPDIFGGMSQ